MNIIFYQASFDDKKESMNEEVDVSEDLYEYLAHTEFSVIGHEKYHRINVDDEMIEIFAVDITPRTRDLITTCLFNVLFEYVSKKVEKISDIDGSESRQNLYDEKSIVELIKSFRDLRFTHFVRSQP